jgi:hypothetical protein
MVKKSIVELAKTIRSKNAGSYYITFEIIFDDYKIFSYIKEKKLISRDIIAEVFDIEPNKIENFNFYDPGLGIKGNIRRDKPSGGPGDSDVYGCQQYAPLLDIIIECVE